MNNLKFKTKRLLAVLILAISCIIANGQSKSKVMDFNNYKKGNTLTIKAYLSDSTDCGEWGGHQERIIIYKNDTEITISYIRDSTECMMRKRFKNKKYNITMRYDCVLNKENEKIIKAYLKKFYRYVPPQNIYSTAGSYYEVSFQEGDFTRSLIIDDKGGTWTEYEAFRNELIKQP